MFTEETAPKAGPLLTQVSSTQAPRTPTWLPAHPQHSLPTGLEQESGPKTSQVPGTEEPPACNWLPGGSCKWDKWVPMRTCTLRVPGA